MSPGCPGLSLGRDWSRNMNSNKFPFLVLTLLPVSFPYFNFELGPPDSCPTTVHTKPFSTSTIQFLFGLFATSTKICTQHCSRLSINWPLLATLLPAYSCLVPHLVHSWSISHLHSFSNIHFQDCFLRQVSYYTLLSGSQLPWSPSCCLKKPTPFVVSYEL